MVRLIKYEDTYYPVMKRWLETEYVKKWYKEPGSWLREIEERASTFSFVHHFIAIYEKAPIGFCQYYKCSEADEEEYRMFPKEGTYSIDYLIGEEAYLGQGIGRELVKEITKKVFEETGSKMIVVQPEKENIPSRKALESNGYRYDEKNQVYVKLKNGTARAVP